MKTETKSLFLQYFSHPEEQEPGQLSFKLLGAEVEDDVISFVFKTREDAKTSLFSFKVCNEKTLNVDYLKIMEWRLALPDTNEISQNWDMNTRTQFMFFHIISPFLKQDYLMTKIFDPTKGWSFSPTFIALCRRAVEETKNEP